MDETETENKKVKFTSTRDENTSLLQSSVTSDLSKSDSSYNADVAKFLQAMRVHDSSRKDDLDNPFNSSSSMRSLEDVSQEVELKEQRQQEQQQQQQQQEEDEKITLHLKQSITPSKRTQQFLSKTHASEQSFNKSYHAKRILPKAIRLVGTFLESALHGTPLWILKFLGLMAFVMAVMPGFVVFAFYYWWDSDRVVVSYKERERGGTSRHFMDVYGSTLRYERIVPSDSKQQQDQEEEEEVLKPVVIFLTGGAWIIGYKMWGALLARALVPFGVLVCMPDYRNFPGVTVGEMVRDVDDSVQWVIDNCREFGGDPKRIVLVGQSAGAHLGSCVVMRKALIELHPNSDQKHDFQLSTTYKNRDLQGFIPISGPYDLVSLRGHFHNHGLDKNIVSMMFGNDIEPHSPYHLFARCMDRLDTLVKEIERDEHYDCVKDKNGRKEQLMRNLFPPICVIHGTKDRTAPCPGAIQFAAALREGGVNVTTKLYPGWSHTDAILEAPMEGDHTLHRDVYNFVKLWTTSTASFVNDEYDFDDNDKDGETKIDEMKEMALMVPFDEKLKICGRLCPPMLVAIGRFFNPF